MNRVVLLPEVNVEFDGAPLEAELGTLLISVRVQYQLGLPAQAELRYQEVGGATNGPMIASPGAALRLTVDTFSEPLFVGEVTGIEYRYGPDGSRQMWVRGYDLLHRLKKSQPVRAFKEVSARSLAEEMAGPLGVSVEAVHDGPLWPILVQYRQSDLEFLVDTTQRCGLYPVLDGSSLRLITLEGLGDALPLVLGESLLEARVDVNGDPSCREVTASGWDTALVALHEGSASEPTVGREIGAEVPPEAMSSDGIRALVDEVASTDSHADALAQAELDRRVADEVTLSAIAHGDPRLVAGRPVEVKGISDQLVGRYVATSVTHTIDHTDGFLTEFSTAAPAQRSRPRASITTVGVVADIDDPEGIGRIRVRLPTYGDVETDWIAVVSAGAGGGKGLITLPDLDDHVLVLFCHENPGRAFVLGGLYGADGPPDTGIVEGAVRRYTLVTPGRQKFVLDDDRQLARLETSTGSYVEMTPEHVRLHSAVDLQIDAPGKAILIRGKTVDFQRAEEPEEPEQPPEPEEPEP